MTKCYLLSPFKASLLLLISMYSFASFGSAGQPAVIPDSTAKQTTGNQVVDQVIDQAAKKSAQIPKAQTTEKSEQVVPKYKNTLGTTGLTESNKELICGYLSRWEPLWTRPGGKTLIVSDDEGTIAVSDGNGQSLYHRIKPTILYTMTNLNLNYATQAIPAYTRGLTCEALSPDGKYLARGYELSCADILYANRSGDYRIEVYNTKTGGLVATLENHRHGVSALKFSPDGKYLASVSSDNLLAVVKTEDWTLVRSYKNFGSELTESEKYYYIESADIIFELPVITVIIRRLELHDGSVPKYGNTIINFNTHTNKKTTTSPSTVNLHENSKVAVLPSKNAYVIYGHGYPEIIARDDSANVRQFRDIVLKTMIDSHPNGRSFNLADHVAFSKNEKYFAVDAYGKSSVFDIDTTQLLQTIDTNKLKADFNAEYPSQS